jgi:hypothetical protein
MAHVYLHNAYTESQIAQMQSTDSDTIIVDNFITGEQLKELRSYIDSIEYPEHGKTSKYAGSAYEHPPYGPRIKELIHEKLLEHIGEHQLDFFAWQEAILPWKIHADLRWYADKIPHKVILIPLDVISDKEGWDDTHSITFKQRNYLRNNPNTDIGKKGNSDQKNWKRAIDNLNTEGCINGYSIDEDTWKNYLSHVPYEHLEGLEIDKIYKWKPGSAIIWDANQLHCADNFLARKIKTKLSIIAMTNQA